MNRAERRRRNKVIYDRRAKLYIRTFLRDVACTPEEAPVHCKWRGNCCYWRRAENYQDLQKNDRSMWLYKNTGTIWDHGYWTKYDRKRLNKQSRVNARNDLRAGVEEIYNRTNIK